MRKAQTLRRLFAQIALAMWPTASVHTPKAMAQKNQALCCINIETWPVAATEKRRAPQIAAGLEGRYPDLLDDESLMVT